MCPPQTSSSSFSRESLQVSLLCEANGVLEPPPGLLPPWQAVAKPPGLVLVEPILPPGLPKANDVPALNSIVDHPSAGEDSDAPVWITPTHSHDAGYLVEFLSQGPNIENPRATAATVDADLPWRVELVNHMIGDSLVTPDGTCPVEDANIDKNITSDAYHQFCHYDCISEPSTATGSCADWQSDSPCTPPRSPMRTRVIAACVGTKDVNDSIGCSTSCAATSSIWCQKARRTTLTVCFDKHVVASLWAEAAREVACEARSSANAISAKHRLHARQHPARKAAQESAKAHISWVDVVRRL